MDVVDEIRTVVVSGVPDILPSDRMADKLVIHFQSLRSNGGDVQNILYPTISTGVAFVTFDNIAGMSKNKQTKKQSIAISKKYGAPLKWNFQQMRRGSLKKNNQ